jgi:hypothetical protein
MIRNYLLIVFPVNIKWTDKGQTKIRFSLLIAFIKSIFVIGFLNKGRTEYWKFIIWTLFNKPYLMAEITYTVYGYHFRTVYGLRHLSS